MKFLSSNGIDTEQIETSSPINKQKIDSRLANKQATNFWITQKQYRVLALYNTSLYILKNQGSVAFLTHLFHFLRGERRNTAIIPASQPMRESKSETELYEQWIKHNSLDEAAITQQKKKARQFAYRPLISILTPVYNTDSKILEKTIKSVLAQTYSNWELCLVDGASTEKRVRAILDKYSNRDQRIKVRYLTENLGIAENSNQALAMAKGEFIALLDHDDELSIDALYENISLLNQNLDADIIYSDEDKLSAEGIRCDPHFKPDWSPDLFYSMMYTCHLGVYRKSLVEKIGGFRAGFDGAQDYDLVLRLIEQTSKIHHIPKVLYHWRKAAGSTAMGLENKNYAKNAQIKAVLEHFRRREIDVEVGSGLAENLLRVKRLTKQKPKVSIIIPTRDQADLLKNCIDSILQKSVYENYEILVVDNQSTEKEALNYLKRISKNKKISVFEYNHPFNFAAINNFAAKRASGEILLFLNNDTEVISEEWLDAMIEHALRAEVGVVGARLLYSNGNVQHAGVIIGIGGVAGHAHKYFHRDHAGYFSRAKAIQNLSAVTGACMMVRKEVFDSVNGFDEKNLAIAFNDIDFCLRVRQRNLLVVYTPYAEMYHHESISRGADKTPEKAMRFQKEAEYMFKVWAKLLKKDPYYSVNLTLDKEDFSLKDMD